MFVQRMEGYVPRIGIKFLLADMDSSDEKGNLVRNKEQFSEFGYWHQFTNSRINGRTGFYFRTQNPKILTLNISSASQKTLPPLGMTYSNSYIFYYGGQSPPMQ